MSSIDFIYPQMLIDTACKALHPKDKVYKKADSKDMCLEIHPNGGKIL